MISRRLVTLSSTSWKDPSHGKVCPANPRQRNMQPLKKRRRRRQLMNFARISQRNSESLCTIAEDCRLRRIPTMVTSSACSKDAWRETALKLRHLTSFGTRTDLFLRKKLSSGKWWTWSTRDRRRKRKRSNDFNHQQNSLSLSLLNEFKMANGWYVIELHK